MDAVRCENVWKIYKQGTAAEVQALRGVDFKIKQGEMVGIIGSSGSGKSTLLNLIGALDKPTKGKIFIDGIDIEKMNESKLATLRREKIGFVFQFFNLIGSLTALQNVELPMIFQGMPHKRRIKRAKELLSDVGLSDQINQRPSELSGGQTQRVAIARALANDPPVILADEPTGNLDSKSGELILEIFKKLNKDKRTIIIVTHDAKIAQRTARIIRVSDGKVMEEFI
jgi:putative ABC transport system ATP-binding protein